MYGEGSIELYKLTNGSKSVKMFVKMIVLMGIHFSVVVLVSYLKCRVLFLKFWKVSFAWNLLIHLFHSKKCAIIRGPKTFEHFYIYILCMFLTKGRKWDDL